MRVLKLLTTCFVVFLLALTSLQITGLRTLDNEYTTPVGFKTSETNSEFFFTEFTSEFDNKIKNSDNKPSPPELKRELLPIDEFYVGNDDFSGYYNTTAELIFESANAYFYVETDVIVDRGLSHVENRVNALQDTFETSIYGNVTTYFGNIEGQLGNIGDGKLLILMCFLSNAAGYFAAENEYSQAYLDSHGMSEYKSNEWEMFYYDWDAADPATLSHELQHLIQYNHKASYADRWFDEGCAQLAEYLSYMLTETNLTGFEDYYFRYESDDSLIWWNYWSDEGKDVRIDYGGAYTFVFYLFEQLGFSAINYIISNSSSTVECISSLLQPYNMTFNDFFLNWQLALLLDNQTLNPQYGFQNLDFTIESLVTIDKDYHINIDVPYYGFYTLTLDYTEENFDTTINIEPGTTSGYVFVYMDDDEIVQIDKGETTNLTLFFPQTTEYTEILVSLAKVEDTQPSISGDFGLGEFAEAEIVSINPLKLHINTPDFQRDNSLIISELDITFLNGTSIVDGSAEDIVSIEIYKTGFSEIYILEYDLTLYNGWGCTIDLAGYEKGYYLVKLVVTSSDYFYSNDIYNFYLIEDIPEKTSWSYIFSILPIIFVVIIVRIRKRLSSKVKI